MRLLRGGVSQVRVNGQGLKRLLIRLSGLGTSLLIQIVQGSDKGQQSCAEKKYYHTFQVLQLLKASDVSRRTDSNSNGDLRSCSKFVWLGFWIGVTQSQKYKPVQSLNLCGSGDHHHQPVQVKIRSLSINSQRAVSSTMNNYWRSCWQTDLLGRAYVYVCTGLCIHSPVLRMPHVLGIWYLLCMKLGHIHRACIIL